MLLARLLAIVALGLASAAATCSAGSRLFVLEFVRPAHYYTDGTERNAVYQFLKNKIKLTEDSAGVPPSLWEGINPAVKKFRYALDQVICVHDDCGYPAGGGPGVPNPDLAGIPEAWFLHYAENTQIQHKPPFQTPAYCGAPTPWLVNIPGCPAGTPVTPACRVVFFSWQDTFYSFDPDNLDYRAWMTARLIAEAGRDYPARGIFLDVHAPTYAKVGLYTTAVLSGGMLREYGLRAQDPAIDAVYGPDLAASLTAHRDALNAIDKFLIVNCAGWSLDPGCKEQEIAAGGMHTETLFTPLLQPGQMDELIALVNTMTQRPLAVVDLFGATCHWGGTGYTSPGNFSTARNRALYWRFAAYLLVREGATATGHAYFDPSFCYSDPWGTGLEFDPTRPGTYQDFQSEWLGAFRSFGAPNGLGFRYQQGASPAGTCDQPTQRNYAVFKRNYSKGIVLVRPRDHWDCSNYGDSTAVEVPLGGSYRLRRDDGTLGPPITTIALRNAEAAILALP